MAPLVAVLKVFLLQQGLFKGSIGGIGSYRLYVVVSAFLETEDTVANRRSGRAGSGDGGGDGNSGWREKIDLDGLLQALFNWFAKQIACGHRTIRSRGHEVDLSKQTVSKLPEIQAALSWASSRLSVTDEDAGADHTGGKNERVREHRSNSSWLSRVVDSDTLERDRCRSIDIARVAEQRHQQRKKYGSRDNNNSSNHNGNRKKRMLSAGNTAGCFANETAKKHKAGDFRGMNFKSPNPSAGSPIE